MMKNKSLEFWLDHAVLALLWVGVLYLPPKTIMIGALSIVDLLKIVTIVGSLEALGYHSHYRLGSKNGLLLQGFLGGLISSTMTFLRVCNLPADSSAPLQIVKALLLAVLAMLIECVLIIYAIHPIPFEISRIIMFQAGLLILILIGLSIFQTKQTSQVQLASGEISDPIVWKKVLYFSMIIIAIIQVLHLANEFLSIPYAYSSLLISLMEAHGVLAAAVTKFSDQSDINQLQNVVAMVLIGNILGKTYFVMRCKIKGVRIPVLLALYGSVVLAIIIESSFF